MQPATLTELAGKAEVVVATGHDPYPLYDVRDDVEVRGWARGAAVAWVAADAFHHGRDALNGMGPATETAQLLTDLLGSGEIRPAIARFPRGVMELLPDGIRPDQWTDWDWWWSVTAPPAQVGEDRVGWLDEDAHDEIAELLEVASPTASADVDDPHVLRWCGIRSARGELLACAADVRHVDGIPHLASIATRPDQRGRGLGAAVTAWISRRCFSEGLGVVTFGMYAHNDPARRMYRRLGFVDRHHWSSARLRATA